MTPITAAAVTRVVLSNGLTVIVKSSTGTGSVAIHGFVKAGAVFDGDRAGHARFTGSALMHGTRRRTAHQMAEDLDAMGASLVVAPGLEVTTVAGKALADDSPALLDTAAEVLMTPAFPAGEVETVRGQLLTAALVNALDTRQVAERLFRRLVYPDGHPHSRNPDGDEAVLAALGPADLQAFHALHFRPEAAAFAVVGDVEPRRAVDLAQEKFGAWASRGPWSMPLFPIVAGTNGPKREEVVLQGKSQADLALGGTGVSRTDPDYYAVMIANLLLGQLGMMGRVGENLRERQGMAYYAYSDLRAGLLAGPWWVRAGVNPANLDRAIAAIVAEIRTLQRDGPDADELADARRFLVGSLAVRLETNQGIAQALADIELYGLGLDYLEWYPAIIDSIGRDDIVAAVRRLPADAYTLAIAGPERVA